MRLASRVLTPVVVGLIAAAGAPMSRSFAHDPATGDSPSIVGCGKAEMLKQRYLMGLDPMGEIPGVSYGPREALTDTDVLNNNVEIEIIPSSATENIKGTNTMTIKSLTNGLTQFTFMLRSQYVIDSIVYNGTTTLTPTNVGSYGRRVTLPAPVNAGTTFTLKITYRGLAVSRGFGSIEFTTQNSQPLVSTLSEAYFSATWWPAKDGDFGLPGDNRDKATMQMAIIAPNTMVSVSNGLLQGVDAVDSSRNRYRWATNYPTAPYLVFFSSTNYNRWQQTYTYPLTGGGTGTMPVEFAIYPSSDSPANRAAWETCLGMFPVFRPMYGEYPFINEKYGMYQFPFGGGMEHQTYTGMGTFNESVVAHELGHQWWGDNVTCRFWNDIWLNEGMATYTECLWAERKAGGLSLAALQAALASRKPSTNSTQTVYVPTGTVTPQTGVGDMNRIFSSDTTYNKGAWVMHMLRHTLGDTLFFDTLKAYRAMYQGSAATTDDFKAVVESMSGKDYDQFFNQWVYGPGAPAYAYGSNSISINGKNYLQMRVRQTQSATFGTFVMPMDVRISTPGGTINTVVNNDAATEHYVIPIGASGAASSAVLDPDVWVLWATRASEAFVQGPPVVVETLPAPGSSTDVSAAPAQLRVYVTQGITASPANFTLTRDGNSVPLSYSFDAPSSSIRITPTGGWAAGAYALTANGVVASSGGLALDGEVSSATSPAALPSGNGLAGGTYALQFTITAPVCAADFNNDGFVDFTDFDAFVSAFEAGGTGADFNNDGFIDFTDFDAYVAAFEAGC